MGAPQNPEPIVPPSDDGLDCPLILSLSHLHPHPLPRSSVQPTYILTLSPPFSLTPHDLRPTQHHNGRHYQDYPPQAHRRRCYRCGHLSFGLTADTSQAPHRVSAPLLSSALRQLERTPSTLPTSRPPQTPTSRPRDTTRRSLASPVTSPKRTRSRHWFDASSRTRAAWTRS